MSVATFLITPSLMVGLLAATASPAAAQAPAPTVTPSTVSTPGKVEARFPFVGLDVDSSVEVDVDSLNAPKDAYSEETSTVKILSARVEGGGTLSEPVRVAAESGACYRGGVYENDDRVYTLSVPAKTTVTLVVSADVPRGLPGRPAGVTISHGQLQAPGVATTAELLKRTAEVQRTGYVDGVSLKASKREGGKVTYTGRVNPARRTTVTLLSQKVDDGTAVAEQGRFFDVVGLRPFTFPEEAFDKRYGAKKIGSVKTAKNGKFRVTLKVPENVGVAARTSGSRAGSSCGVLAGSSVR